MPMRIDHRDVAFQWGPPGSLGTDYETPQYFSAGKQDKCVIAISNSPDVDEPDWSVWATVYAAATAIIQQCVIRQGVGGYIPYEGHDGNMAISVFSWDFRLNNPPPTAQGLENKIKYASRFSEASSQTQQQDTSANPPAKKQKTCSAGGNGYVKDATGCCAGFEYTKQKFLDAAVQFGVRVGQA
ncbi:MAG: hypothetical protein M1835_003532, partial [Candelina submexicana]